MKANDGPWRLMCGFFCQQNSGIDAHSRKKEQLVKQPIAGNYLKLNIKHPYETVQNERNLKIDR